MFVAVKNKMDLSIAVALGSSIQVCALCHAVPAVCTLWACLVACDLHAVCMLSAAPAAPRMQSVGQPPDPEAGQPVPLCLHQLLLQPLLPATPLLPAANVMPQIAVFLIPVVVLAGWAMGKPFTLDFDSFAVLMLTGA